MHFIRTFTSDDCAKFGRVCFSVEVYEVIDFIASLTKTRRFLTRAMQSCVS